MHALVLALWLFAALAPAATQPLARGPMPVDFDGERYSVDYQAQVQQPDGSAGQGIAEFTLPGESVENWTKLIGYHYYPEQAGTPAEAVDNLGKYLKEINKDFTFQIVDSKYLRKDEKGDAIIEFMTWEANSEVIEFNVFKYARPAEGPGLIALQYARRFKLSDMSVEAFQDLRQRSVAAMIDANIEPMRAYFDAQYKNPATREDAGGARAERPLPPKAAAR